jgi:transposase
MNNASIALKWQQNGEVTEWNSVFAYAALEMGPGVELCWPYQARQKGPVENLVGYVKSSFFKVRSFQDEEDLQQQLVEWHREVNLKAKLNSYREFKSKLRRRAIFRLFIVPTASPPMAPSNPPATGGG